MTRAPFFVLTLTALLLPFASEAQEQKALPELRTSVRGDRFEANPPKDHHFNIQAPATVKVGKTPLKFEYTERRLGLRLPKTASNQALNLDVYLCDDAKTFCRKKSQTIQ